MTEHEMLNIEKLRQALHAEYEEAVRYAMTYGRRWELVDAAGARVREFEAAHGKAAYHGEAVREARVTARDEFQAAMGVAAVRAGKASPLVAQTRGALVREYEEALGYALRYRARWDRVDSVAARLKDFDAMASKLSAA